MKAFFLFLCITCAYANFFPEIEDIPMPERSVVIPSSVGYFSTLQGRLYTAKIHITSTIEIVQNFYKTTLPSLGWVPSKDQSHYIRNDEVLSLTFTSTKSGCEMTLLLSPLQKSIDQHT